MLFTSYYGEVCNHIYRYINDQDTVRDVAQELFTELWTKRDTWNVTTSIGAYLHRMAGSRALNYIRDHKKHQHSDDTGLSKEPAKQKSPDADLITSELSEIVTLTVNALPDRCRTVFMLSRYENMTNAQIADALDISVKTVENQMTKALRTLKEAVKKYGTT